MGQSPQLPGQTMGPDPHPWWRNVQDALETVQSALQNQPLAKVLGSPMGQMMAGEIMPPSPKIGINLLEGRPMPPGAIFRKNFNDALDEAYAAPPAAGPRTRGPLVKNVDRAYFNLAGQGLAADPKELETLRGQVGDRIEAFKDFRTRTMGPEPTPEIASPELRARAILDHVTKQLGYKAEDGDLDKLTGIIRDLQRVGPLPSHNSRGERQLGEVARQVAGQLPQRTPLQRALRQATGWADVEGRNGGNSRQTYYERLGNVRGDKEERARQAMLAQMKQEQE